MTSQLRMADRHAVITGAGAGIGAATALVLAREGASVLLIDNQQAGLDKTAALIAEHVPHARTLTWLADVSDEASALAGVERAYQQWGRLDTLVNNASMRNYTPAAQATSEEWHAMVNVNLLGMSNYCRATLPHLREAGRASIVNVSSCYAVTGRKGMALYDATKAAQLAYTRSLAFEEVEHGVRVNAVCPGSTLTDFHVGRAVQRGKSVDTLKTERQSTSLIGRWADPMEIALPILWLASEEASFMTGTTLMADGGLHIM